MTASLDPENAQATKQDAQSPVLAKWLHMLDTNENAEIENSSVLAFAPRIPGDLARVLKSVGRESGSGGFLYVLFLAIISISFGFLFVFGAKRIFSKWIAKLELISPPAHDSASCLWAGFIRSIPALASVVLLALSATLLFLLLAEDVTAGGRMLFQLCLGIVLILKTCSLVFAIIFAPENIIIRPLALTDSVAKSLYRATVISIAVILSGKLIG